MAANPTIQTLAADLTAGRTTSRKLTEEALARIADAAGEGKRAFVKVWRDQALAAADASDLQRKAGLVPSPLAGLPVSIKNLCDVAGETTLSGSKALDDAFDGIPERFRALPGAFEQPRWGLAPTPRELVLEAWKG